MFQLLGKIQAIRAAYNAGDYREAGRLAWELAGDVLGFRGVAEGGPDDDPDACEKEVKALLKDAKKPLPRGAKRPKGEPVGNPAVVIALIQLLGPVILDWIKKRRQG